MMNELAHAGQFSWRKISIDDRRRLRAALIAKHGSLTLAAEAMQVDYQTLSHVICGRARIIPIVHAIQSDLELSDQRVLDLWPLLRRWPRPLRVVN